MRFLRASALVLLLAVCATPLFAQGVPLTMSKNFSPSTVLVGGSSTTIMTVTITNPNAFTVSGISVSDTYPAGLVPDMVGAYTCTPGSAAFNASGWSFSGFSLAAGASCSIPMHMHATMTGAIVNTTSQVTSTQVPPGGPASATLNVVAPEPAIPTLSQRSLLLLAAAIATVVAMRLRS
jgi:hypothetical protein